MILKTAVPHAHLSSSGHPRSTTSTACFSVTLCSGGGSKLSSNGLLEASFAGTSLPLQQSQQVKANDLSQTNQMISGKLDHEWSNGRMEETVGLINSNNGFQASLKLCCQIEPSVMMETVCGWAVRYGSH